MEPAEIRARVKELGWKISDLAHRAGMDPNHLTKALGKQGRRIQAGELDAIRAVFAAEESEPTVEPIRTIAWLGEVPAGRPSPAEQRGGRRLAVSDPETPTNAYALTVKGDSMDLVVPSGTTLVIDPDDMALWPGRRYVIMTVDGRTTFKEYQDGPARLIPCSTNDEHTDLELGAEPIKVLGRVFSYSLRDVPRRRG